MQRKKGWPELLDTFIQSNSHRRFKMGELDCGIFAADMVLAITGIDMCAWRGSYSTVDGARTILKEYGGTNTLRAFMRRLMASYAVDEVSPSFARRGDVVLVERGRGSCSLAVIGLDGSVIAPGRRGLKKLSRESVVLAWAI